MVNSRLIRIFALPFIIAGLVMLTIGLRGLALAHASSSWPTAEGIVAASEIRTQRGHEGGATYHPEVRYQYEVEGRTYSGTTIAIGDHGSSDRSRADNIINRYPVNQTVQVFYRPDAPEVSLLEPGIQLQAFFLLAIGSVFLTGGVLVFWFLPAVMRKNADARTPRGSNIDASI